jgi:hypothetical protein
MTKKTKFVQDELGDWIEVETIRCYPTKGNVIRFEPFKADGPMFYPPPISVDLLSAHSRTELC